MAQLITVLAQKQEYFEAVRERERGEREQREREQKKVEEERKR